MSTAAVIVENVAKRYIISHQKGRGGNLGGTFSERIQQSLTAPLKWFKRSEPTETKEDFWALNDVSFELRRGEVLGIIGRNGAGKSTLLKILSRITDPTRGSIRLRGRVASLLEVGTGFHPELTGRENIYLNGAILGMTRAEIRSRFDEIVDFSGVEKFLDTPVKRYSSGMYVRLAFAVAAHLEPEILIVDEVLAVGDADFQKKCLGKMENVSKSGRTILFVSHNMGTISSLCSRAILMDRGRVAADGTPAETIMAYYTQGRATPFKVDFTGGPPVRGEGATLLSAMVTTGDGAPAPEVLINRPCEIRMRYRLEHTPGTPLFPNFHFCDSSGGCAFVTSAMSQGLPNASGEYEAVCHVPANFLNDGTYFVSLALTRIDNGVKIAFYEKDALCLHARDPIEETLHTSRNGWSGPVPGSLRPQLDWTVNLIS